MTRSSAASVRAVCGTALVAAIVLIGGSLPATAAPSETVVISQVYGGGGNSGATFTHDFNRRHSSR